MLHFKWIQNTGRSSYPNSNVFEHVHSHLWLQKILKFHHSNQLQTNGEKRRKTRKEKTDEIPDMGQWNCSYSLQKQFSLVVTQVLVKQTTEFYSDFLWCNYSCVSKTSKILLLSIVCLFVLTPKLRWFSRLLQIRVNQFISPTNIMSFVLLIQDRKCIYCYIFTLILVNSILILFRDVATF